MLTRSGFTLVADVSAAQDGATTPPWDAMLRAGVVAVVCKADATWAEHATVAAESGFMVGSYFVLNPAADPIAQAARYHAIAFDRTALFPAIDFELQRGVPGETCVERAAVFCAEVERLFRKRPLVYCSPGFIASLGASDAALARLAAYDLWLADYASEPVLPRGWREYVGWQWEGGSTRIAGVPLDLSYFRGDEATLAALGASLA